MPNSASRVQKTHEKFSHPPSGLLSVCFSSHSRMPEAISRWIRLTLYYESCKTAYLSSLTQCFSWITKIIPDTSAFNLHMDELISSRRLVSDRSFPSDLLFNLAKTQRLQIQNKINEALDKFTLESLTRSPTITLRDKALLMCSSTQYAGSWLSACPSRLKGNYLESRLFTLAFRYWFGVPIFPDGIVQCLHGQIW